MEYYRTLYKNTCTNGSNGVRGHDGNFPIHAWQDQNQNQNQSSWDLIRTYHNNNNNINNTGSSNDVVVNNYPLYNALSFAAAGAGASHARTPDPHLTCLKLGKRDYFEDVVVIGSSSPQPPKKGKAQSGGSVPRCQVEGCESALASAKDYHRRHKVCEMHAKAPSVVVHGMEQRFCQQCSRFHAVVEFDDSKRSCRRRLAGHNERRRKQSTTSQEHNRHSQGKYPHSSVSSSGECALSLLSSSTNNYESNPWNYASPSSSSDDLPARCSAALRELIAENRASVLACRQLVVNPNNNFENCNTNNNSSSNNAYRLGLGRGGPKLSESGAGGGGHVTLDLMQDPDSAFGLLSVHDHGRHKSPKQAGNNNGDQDCSDLWRVPLGY